MRHLHRRPVEYALKGLLAGLVAWSMLRPTSVGQALLAPALVAGALLVGIVGSHLRRRLRGGGGRLLPFALLTLIESQAAVFAAVLGGWGAAAAWQRWLPAPTWGLATAGAATGVGFALLLPRTPAKWRTAVALALLAAFAAMAWTPVWREWIPQPQADAGRAVALLAGSLGFYLLCLAGERETEYEIGLICLAMAGGLAQLRLPPLARGVVLLGPALVFFLYSHRLQRKLAVFKQTVRGLGHEQQGRTAAALRCYRAALADEPDADLAAAGVWRIHHRLDPALLAGDAELAELVEPRLCLRRVDRLLAGAVDDRTAERVGKLLELVEVRRPDWPLTVAWRRLRLALAVGAEDALAIAAAAVRTAPAEAFALPAHEAAALYGVWHEWLTHPRLAGPGGLPDVATDDGLWRMLAATQRRHIDRPDDEVADALRTQAHGRLTMTAYRSFAAEHGPPRWLDRRLCWRQAVELADTLDADADADAAGRMAGLLAIAAEGLPADRPVIWSQLAALADRDDPAVGDDWRRRVRDAGRPAGGGAAEKAYFDAVGTLATRAEAAGDLAEAIRNQRLSVAAPQSGLPTLATLVDLCRRAGDVLGAIHATESALAYPLPDAQSRRWMRTKTDLYAAAEPAAVQGRLEAVRGFFDFAFCHREAVRRFERREPAAAIDRFLELAALEGGQRLIAVNTLLGRSAVRRGDDAAAIQCLEQVCRPDATPPADDDLRASYDLAHRLLGDLLLRHGRPAEAARCLRVYSECVRSGAETLYLLGQAHEAAGQPAHARKWYDMVLVYAGHPRAADARAALERLERPAG